MQSLHKQIKYRIGSMRRGKLFTTATFLGLGSRAGVDQVLSRLVRSGYIKRLARGVFIKPKQSEFVDEVMPGVQEVVQQITKQQGYRVQIHGAEAVRKFSLSTRTPVQPVFLTNGPSKVLKIGNQVVHLKHVPARKLGPNNQRVSEAIVALWYLGKNGVTQKEVEKIGKHLSPTEKDVLLQAAPMMPAWMVEKIRRVSWQHKNG